MAESVKALNEGYSAQLFREIETLEGLMLEPDERSWIERPPDRPQAKATVLYLGCNVLRTPHLAQTAVAVLQYLGEDFIALGGPAFCCGVPFQYEGLAGDARRSGEKLNSHFGRFQPRQVVMWCPTCLYFYKSVLGLSASFRLLHMTEFLAEKRQLLHFAPVRAVKAALHYHTGSSDVEGHSAAARSLLNAVPGLELIEIGGSDVWGRACTGRMREQMGRQPWEALIMPFFMKAADLGAQLFATLYHSCHRMYCGYQDRFPFTVEHHLSVLGRALGIDYPDKYKKYLLWKDRDRILDDARTCLQANRLRPESAHDVVDRVFVDDKGF